MRRRGIPKHIVAAVCVYCIQGVRLNVYVAFVYKEIFAAYIIIFDKLPTSTYRLLLYYYDFWSCIMMVPRTAIFASLALYAR